MPNILRKLNSFTAMRVKYGSYAVIASGAVTGPYTVNYAVIAGGGGTIRVNGGGSGGGGGAGGFRSSVSPTGGGGSPESELSFVAPSGISLTITVGAGGASSARYDNGTVGVNSSIIGGAVSITSNGGGYGSIGNYSSRNGGAGGSGGGAGQSNAPTYSASGGSGTANQGYAGGANGNGDAWAGGAGGGAGGVGADTTGSTAVTQVGGNGGAGVSNNITGTSQTYSCGGRGGSSSYNQNYGNNASGWSATANTGNGMSGSDNGNGHSGVVILKYSSSFAALTGGSGLTFASPVISGGFQIYTFTDGLGSVTLP